MRYFIRTFSKRISDWDCNFSYGLPVEISFWYELTETQWTFATNLCKYTKIIYLN